mmetsp:Transcript_66874/g.111913  ORF Transcript_66874/g.111913 Transcript_66874/m.111913 type:complete len:309 (+) Transcript_66874:210-1136(+)
MQRPRPARLRDAPPPRQRVRRQHGVPVPRALIAVHRDADVVLGGCRLGRGSPCSEPPRPRPDQHCNTEGDAEGRRRGPPPARRCRAAAAGHALRLHLPATLPHVAPPRRAVVHMQQQHPQGRRTASLPDGVPEERSRDLHELGLGPALEVQRDGPTDHGAGHGGAGHPSGPGPRDGAVNRGAGRVEGDAGPVVRERGSVVLGVRRAHRDHPLRLRGPEVARAPGRVPGRDDGDDPDLQRLQKRPLPGVEAFRRAAQRHAHDAGVLVADPLRYHPIDTLDNVHTGRSAPFSREHFDRDNRRRLRHAVRP